MPNFLLNLHFDKTGCTNSSVKNLGGVSFTDTSSIIEAAGTAYFKPFNDNAGLWLENVDRLKDHFNSNQNFTIYLKYRIKKENLDKNTKVPILSYKKNNKNSFNNFIYIEEAGYFTFQISPEEKYSSAIVDYTFNDKWHYLTITREDNVLRIFVDGCLTTINDIQGSMIFGDELFIGYKRSTRNDVFAFNGGYLDDISIIDECIYYDTFIPPTLYITTEDTIENYFRNNHSNVLGQLEPETQDLIDHKMESTSYYFNEAQRGYLPQRLRIKWHEEREYFKNEEWNRESKYIDSTVISLYNMAHDKVGFEEKRFFEGTAYHLLANKEINPFLLFVDGKFVPLSEIYMIRSDDFYTVFINNRDPILSGPVKSVEYIKIPFPVIYEEFIGEREDKTPIYKFNKDGYFDNSQSAIYFYYIDNESAPNTKVRTNGIYEQTMPSYVDSEGGSEKHNDDELVHYVWRYGNLEAKRVHGKNIFMYFRAWDHGYVKPGDQIVLYRDNVPLDPRTYRLMGVDLIEFFNYQTLDLPDTLYTMEIITDNSDWLIEDYATSKIFSMVAEEEEQTVFQLPVEDWPDVDKYNQILIFNGSIFLNQNDYIVNNTNHTVTFTNSTKIIHKGDTLIFAFVNITKGSQHGPLHLKPYFFSQEIKANSNSITLPDMPGLEYNMNNFMLFIDDKVVIPRRYRIEGDKLVFMEANDGVKQGQIAVFTLFKLVSEYDDPTNIRYKAIQEELSLGRRFILYDMTIDKKYKITLDNLVAFDQNGRYIPDLFGQIYNRNIIKCLYSGEPMLRVPTYISCIWMEDSLPNEALAVHPTNNAFMNGYIALFEEFYEMDDHFKELMSDFNTRYYKSKHYGENLARALDYMACYQQIKFDKVYEDRATADRVTFDVGRLNSSSTFDANGDIAYEMERNEFNSRYYRSFPIYFLNGIVPDWYDQTSYSGNRVTIHTPTKLKNGENEQIFTETKVIGIPMPFEFDKTIGVEDTNDLYLKEYGDKKSQFGKVRYKGSALADIKDVYRPRRTEFLGRINVDFEFDYNERNGLINVITVMSGFGEPLCNLYVGNQEEYKQVMNALNPHNPVFSYNLKDIENRSNLRLSITYKDDQYRFVLSRNRRIIESVYLPIPYSNGTVIAFGSTFDTTNNGDYRCIKLKQFEPDKELTFRGTARFIYGTYRTASSVDVLESIRCHKMVNFLQPLDSQLLYINNNTQDFLGKVRTGFEASSEVFSIVEVPEKTRESEFTASIRVKPGLALYERDISFDIPSQVQVKVDINPIDIDCDVDLYVWDYVDPTDNSGESYEFYCKVNPSYNFTPVDIPCKIEVPIVIIKA